MNDADVNDVIIVSVGTIVVTTLIRHGVQKKKTDTPVSYIQPIVFGFFLVIMLMLLAIPLPTFTKGLALLGLVGAFAVNGPAVFKLLGGK